MSRVIGNVIGILISEVTMTGPGLLDPEQAITNKGVGVQGVQNIKALAKREIAGLRRGS